MLRRFATCVQRYATWPTVIIFLDLKCPRDRQVRSEFRDSTAVNHAFFNGVCFDFVTLFAQLWLNVFCLRSQNELKNFHSALQISQWNDVNLLWEFSLTYNGLNDILISSNGLYFIFYFICQSWHMLEMLSLEVGAFYVQVSYTNKLGGVRKPLFLGIIKGHNIQFLSTIACKRSMKSKQ